MNFSLKYTTALALFVAVGTTTLSAQSVQAPDPFKTLLSQQEYAKLGRGISYEEYLREYAVMNAPRPPEQQRQAPNKDIDRSTNATGPATVRVKRDEE